MPGWRTSTSSSRCGGAPLLGAPFSRANLARFRPFSGGSEKYFWKPLRTNGFSVPETLDKWSRLRQYTGMAESNTEREAMQNLCDHESIVFTDRYSARYSDERTGYCEDCGVNVTIELDEDGYFWSLMTEGDEQYDAAVEDALIEGSN